MRKLQKTTKKSKRLANNPQLPNKITSRHEISNWLKLNSKGEGVYCDFKYGFGFGRLTNYDEKFKFLPEHHYRISDININQLRLQNDIKGIGFEVNFQDKDVELILESKSPIGLGGRAFPTRIILK